MTGCPGCGAEDESERFCTRCGTEIGPTVRPSRRWLWVTAAAVAVALVAAGGSFIIIRSAGPSTPPPVSAEPPVSPAVPTGRSSSASAPPSAITSISLTTADTSSARPPTAEATAEAPAAAPTVDPPPTAAPTTAPEPATEQIRIAAVDSTGNPAAGYTIHDVPDAGVFGCDYPSAVSLAPGIHSCGPTAASADVCWGTSDRITLLCLYDPWATELQRMRADQAYAEVPAATDPLPWGLELADGSQCRIRNGGAWPGRPDGLTGAYSCDGETAFVLADGTEPVVDRTAALWSVQVGSLDGNVDQPPPILTAVDRAYFADVAAGGEAAEPDAAGRTGVDPDPYRLRSYTTGPMTAADNGELFFTSPSGNISCLLGEESAGFGAVICLIKEKEFPDNPRPGSCSESLSWAGAFVTLGSAGAGQGICTGDSPVPPHSSVLPYGSALEHGDYRCSSAETGVTCTGPNGGFTLNRASFTTT